jgi:hypothetical protein
VGGGVWGSKIIEVDLVLLLRSEGEIIGKTQNKKMQKHKRRGAARGSSERKK